MKLQIFFKDDKKHTLYALRANTCEFSVYTVRIFVKCTCICAAEKNYLFFTKLFIEPDFPCLADEIAVTTYLFFTKSYKEPDFPRLADEIAVPRPDMYINIAAFTVRERLLIPALLFS